MYVFQEKSSILLGHYGYKKCLQFMINYEILQLRKQGCCILPRFLQT